MNKEEKKMMGDVITGLNEIISSCQSMLHMHPLPKSIEQFLKVTRNYCERIRLETLHKDNLSDLTLTNDELIERIVLSDNELSKRGIDFRKAIFKKYAEMFKKS